MNPPHRLPPIQQGGPPSAPVHQQEGHPPAPGWQLPPMELVPGQVVVLHRVKAN